jgi:gamma-glutamyltranspeptidase/glutathione hydrolase
VLKHLGVRNMQPGSAEHIWAMGHALRQAGRHWEYAQDDTIYGVPREEVLDDGYHAHLAKMIRIARPKVDLTEHIKLAGDSGSGGDFMSAFFDGGGKPRLGTTQSGQPTGSCDLAVVDAEGNWVQMMDTLQGSGIPGMVIDGVPMVGSHSAFGGLTGPMDATLAKGAKP